MDRRRHSFVPADMTTNNCPNEVSYAHTIDAAEDRSDGVVTVGCNIPDVRGSLNPISKNCAHKTKMQIETPTRKVLKSAGMSSAGTGEKINGGSSGSVDFTSVMFLSIGGATIATPTTLVSASGAKPEHSRTGGTATWSEYRPYAKHLFWTITLPIFSCLYLTIALVMYLATVGDWAHRRMISLALSSIAGVLLYSVTLWTGMVAYKLRRHPVVINRGLVHVAQVHAGITFGIPAACTIILKDSGYYTFGHTATVLMNIYLSLCSFIVYSAIVARQRQIVLLFSNSHFKHLSEYTYRNTVYYIGAMYAVGIIAQILLAVLRDDTTYSYIVVTIVDFTSIFIWFFYAYRSRHTNARYSDFDQLQRLAILFGSAMVATQCWTFAQHEAHMVQVLVAMGLMGIFLLDSYLSLFNFIQYELDPKRIREVEFSPQPSTSATPEGMITTVANVQPSYAKTIDIKSGNDSRSSIEDKAHTNTSENVTTSSVTFQNTAALQMDSKHLGRC